MHQPADLSDRLKQRAAELGFQLSGICAAVPPAGLNHLDAWLEAGYAGQMHYLVDRRQAYDHPRHVLDGVRSIVMLGMRYSTEPPGELQPGTGRVSRYAWGVADYHDLIRDRLHQLSDYFRELVPEAKNRGVVDTAPFLEREFAQMAGLGWVGKNTLLLTKDAGSYFFLAALLTDQTLGYDESHANNHCGTCTACLDACPTDAFVEPYVLDATRCISYLTIELQKTIPTELRSGIGDWLFGCDVCQMVCPWNKTPPEAEESEFLPQEKLNPVDLETLFDLDESQFRAQYRRTPLWRAHRRGLLRNAAIVLGNQRQVSALLALKKGLADDEPLVRGACAWALGQLDTSDAKTILQARQSCEDDPRVQQEISDSLSQG